MTVFAVDPGNIQSGYCLIDVATLRPILHGKKGNEALAADISCGMPELELHGTCRPCIEMLACYGMAVGKTVFDTAVWVGRFYELLMQRTGCEPELIYRMEEKMHICHSAKAKDANLRQALIDRFAQHDFKNGKGTKKNPDWFYGFSADAWAAYCVGITYLETHLDTKGNR